jgi:acyl carrier protein
VPPETDANEGTIDRDRVLEIITARVAEILEVDPLGIREEDSFSEDLHLGSLEIIELVDAMEEEFVRLDDRFRVEDDDLENLRSVRDAVDYVISRL